MDDFYKFMSDRLKPCPLCGNKIQIEQIEIADSSIKRIVLNCETCYCRTDIEPPMYYSYDKVYRYISVENIWNNRYNDSKGRE